MTEHNGHGLLTVKQASQRLGMADPACLYYHLRKNNLRFLQIGSRYLIPESEVEALEAADYHPDAASHSWWQAFRVERAVQEERARRRAYWAAAQARRAEVDDFDAEYVEPAPGGGNNSTTAADPASNFPELFPEGSEEDSPPDLEFDHPADIASYVLDRLAALQPLLHQPLNGWVTISETDQWLLVEVLGLLDNAEELLETLLDGLLKGEDLALDEN